jgi:hypothetical protein
VKYQSPSTYYSKVIGKVKVSDRMTDRTKTICPPIFDLRGIKIIDPVSILVRIDPSHPLVCCNHEATKWGGPSDET